MYPTTHSSLRLCTLHLSIYPSIIHSPFIHFSFHSLICHLFIFSLNSASFHSSTHQPSFIPLLILPFSNHISIHPCINLFSLQSSFPFSLLFTHTSVHPPFHLFICPLTHLLTNLSFLSYIQLSPCFYLCIHTSIYASMHHPQIHPFFIFHLPVHPHIHVSIQIYVFSTHQPTCESIQPPALLHPLTHPPSLHLLVTLYFMYPFIHIPT